MPSIKCFYFFLFKMHSLTHCPALLRLCKQAMRS